jgi:hypothetical protein
MRELQQEVQIKLFQTSVTIMIHELKRKWVRKPQNYSILFLLQNNFLRYFISRITIIKKKYKSMQKIFINSISTQSLKFQFKELYYIRLKFEEKSSLFSF